MQTDARHQDSTAPAFTQHGGYRVGGGGRPSFAASWPFGVIEVEPGHLKLQCLTRQFQFPAASITKLTVRRRLLSAGGLRIEHDIASYPARIEFTTFDIGKLRNQLERAGFLIGESRVVKESD